MKDRDSFVTAAAKPGEKRAGACEGRPFFFFWPLIDFNPLPGSSMNVVGLGRRDALHRQHHEHLES